MINWRDVRSRRALNQFLSEFETLPQAQKDVILAEQAELMDRQVDETPLRADAPHKLQEKTRGKRQRRPRRK